MTWQWLVGVLGAVALAAAPASAQAPGAAPPLALRHTDPAHGLSLEQAIAMALEREPSLRAARTEPDVARSMRLQAGLRPNPAISFERRDEPTGTDSQTMVGIQWPLDLFRRGGRIAVAERTIDVARLAVADRERVLAADVRARYGEVLAAVRDLAVIEDLVSTLQRQHALLEARVAEGASPPLERDLLDVELTRLESDRLIQAGRTEAALVELKRVLGLPAAAPLSVRDTLEAVVHLDAAADAGHRAGARDEAADRPDVREAAARVELADARIDRAEREGRFDISLFASYMRMDAGFPQRGFTADGALARVRGVFHNVAAGATVTVPLLNRNQGEAAAARAERAGAALAYDAARLTAQAEVAAARAQDEHARQAVALYSTRTRALARQNLTIVGDSYGLGRATVFDVLSEQRRYLDVERGFTAALRAAYEARTALERALGDLP